MKTDCFSSSVEFPRLTSLLISCLVQLFFLFWLFTTGARFRFALMAQLHFSTILFCGLFTFTCLYHQTISTIKYINQLNKYKSPAMSYRSYIIITLFKIKKSVLTFGIFSWYKSQALGHTEQILYMHQLMYFYCQPLNVFLIRCVY